MLTGVIFKNAFRRKGALKLILFQGYVMDVFDDTVLIHFEDE